MAFVSRAVRSSRANLRRVVDRGRPGRATGRLRPFDRARRAAGADGVLRRSQRAGRGRRSGAARPSIRARPGNAPLDHRDGRRRRRGPVPAVRGRPPDEWGRADRPSASGRAASRLGNKTRHGRGGDRGGAGCARSRATPGRGVHARGPAGGRPAPSRATGRICVSAERRRVCGPSGSPRPCGSACGAKEWWRKPHTRLGSSNSI
jgi:hypothetical protein